MSESVGAFKLMGMEAGNRAAPAAVVALTRPPSAPAAAPAKRVAARRGPARSQGALALAAKSEAGWKEF
jgi:hypothetical protein